MVDMENNIDLISQMIGNILVTLLAVEIIKTIGDCCK